MNHNIAFFSESNFDGKIPRDFKNMRTEYAWYVALNATHHWVGNLPSMEDNMYDLGIIILPKKNISQLMQVDLIKQMRKVCKKIGYMQEGPSWYFQDYPMDQQIWFYNILMEVDVIFGHNQADVDYFKGLTEKKHIYQNKSLMITDSIEPHIVNPDARDGVIIGGNMVRWYGGFDSYMVAQEFGESIYAPSMGRKIKREEEMDITHLPYMNHIDWMNNLSRFKYAVHLMPTQAAGTFALNCAYHGIPCIGYKGLDTQTNCHPQLNVSMGDLEKARKLANKLKNDKGFYKTQSETAKNNFNSFFGETEYIYNMKKVIEKVMSND
ncbi:MAG: hypothetical protein CBC24_09475 [Candidatus Pelagibacter sp. TMED64]|nr:MAG: hypothetical protein CBC24_09475 [Candidatus Pelagibacter sp. TMED64]